MQDQEDEIARIRGQGYWYTVIGAAILFLNVAAFYAFHETSVTYQVVSVMMVPAGWYGMFTGIGKVIDEPASLVEREKLYSKFEKAEYIFLSEEKE